MKSFNTRSNPSALSALTLAVFALVHGAASAAASDDDLKKTKLYGDVSIADDSSSSWGPWSNFEPPAAGPATGTNEPIKRTVEMYRPLAQPLSLPVPAVESIGLGCAGGSLCGFGVFSGNDGFNNSNTHVAPHAWMVTGTVVTPGQSSLLPAAISLQMTALSEGASLLMPDSGTLYMNDSNNGGMSDVTYQSPPKPGLSYSVRGSADQGYNYLAEATQVAGVSISQYLQGNSGGETQSNSYQQRYGQGVIGITTPNADMAALRADNFKATYRGMAIGEYGGSPVIIAVQFGSGTWQGSWNGGADGSVGINQYQFPGKTVLSGQVGFTAVGTINGVNIQSTSVGTLDKNATVSGYVKGAFFGPMAAAIGGVADITKTRTAVPANVEAPALQAASVQTTTQVYTNASYVAPFVAVKDTLLKSVK